MSRFSLSRLVALAAAVAMLPVARLESFPPSVALAVGLVAAWRWLAGTDGRALVSRRLRLATYGLAGLASIVLLHDLAAGGPAPLVSLLVLIAVVETVALLHRQAPFIAFLTLLLSTIHVAGAAFLQQDAVALLLTAGYLVVLTWALVVFERHAANLRAERQRGAVRRLRVGSADDVPAGAVARSVLALTVLGFVGGFVLYLVIPREPFAADRRAEAANANDADSADALPNKLPDPEAFASFTGPGEKGIQLGDIGKIKRDLAPYFEVWMPEGRSPWLRENTYDVYRRGDWTAFAGDGVPPARAAGTRPGLAGWIALDREDDAYRGYNVRMRIVRGPQKRLYLARDPVRVRLLRHGRPISNVLGISDNEQVNTYVPLQAGDHVEHRSVPPVTDPNALEAARSDRDVSPRLTFVNLPEECAPLVPLAQAVVGSETNPWKRCRILTAWLKSEEFTYTLQMPEVDSNRPVVDFLLEKRSGHCEYFASSMALLLRALGHPARVVRGFRGGDWQPGRGSWLVRGIHYHAWTEMYFAGLGWIPVDSTPPDREAADAESITREANRPSAKERRPLAEVLLGWGQEERAALAQALRSGADRFVRRPLAFAFGPRGYYAGFAVALVGGLLLVRRRRRRSQAQRAGLSGTRLPPGLYGRALHVLSRRGLKRKRAQTARDFERSVRRAMPGASPHLASITRMYEAERFGGHAPPPDAVREARASLDRLSSAVAPRKQP